MKTIIDPLNNKRYSVFSKQGKQILKSYVKSFKNQRGAANHQQNPGIMTGQDRRRMRTYLLSQQRLRNQAIQEGTYNPVGVRLPNNVMQNISSHFRRYTPEQVAYIQANNLNVDDADENGNINCENCEYCVKCENCIKCIGCIDCRQCEDCRDCYEQVAERYINKWS